MNSDKHTRQIIIRLLGGMASPKEIRQYLDRFSCLETSRFAVVKVGGAVLRDEMDSLASSLSFLQRVGLIPIVIHGAGPQLDEALASAGISCEIIDGLRCTPPEALSVVRRVMIAQNLRLVEALQRLDTRATSITGGVIEARLKEGDRLGLVGEVDDIHLDPIRASLKANSIPVLCCLGETAHGQILNVNADTAANALVRRVQPYKVVFLTGTGGLLDEAGEIIPSISLSTQYEHLVQQDWVHSGMRLKLEQIRDLLEDLPLSSSVSITRPEGLARELFTHRGSGTLIRKGEPIRTFTNWADVDQTRLRELLEGSFRLQLDADYFDVTPLTAAYVTESYRAAAIISAADGLERLDKFAVSAEAQGEGLGRAVWLQMRAVHPQLFWRSRPENVINEFYFQESDGCIKTENWNIFWYGIDEFPDIQRCVELFAARPATLN